jgi:hypothetical protein
MINDDVCAVLVARSPLLSAGKPQANRSILVRMRPDHGHRSPKLGIRGGRVLVNGLVPPSDKLIP